MEPINFFASVDFLEPKCPKCNSKLEYGTNTRYSEKEGTHVCMGCGVILK